MAQEKQVIRVEISYKTIIFAVSFLAFLWLLIQIKEIIILVFISLILLSALLKPVEWINSKRVPRVLAILLVYIAIIALFGFVIGTIVPPLISQSSAFLSKLPQIISSVNDFFIFYKIPAADLSQIIARQFQQVAGNLVEISKTIFSSIILIITLFVITFYLLLEWKKFLRFVASPFSGKQEKQVINVITKVENGLGKWVRGQLTLSIIVGVMSYIGLLILGIPYALPLSLIAAILEIVPVVGPIIASIPAILVGLSLSPIVALSVAALFVIVQQLENHIFVPVIMSRAIGLQPPAVIVALLIGAKIAGIGGAFLAVPVIVVIKIVIEEFIKEEEEIEDGLIEE